MTYSDAIKDGFRLISSRWQLVAVQAGLMLFNCLSFFILVGIPLGIAFVIFGLDLTGLSQVRDFLGVLRNPAELLSKYFGLVLVVVISFLFYLLLVTVIGLYVFSGSIGTLGRALLDPDSKFSMRSFSAEAKKFFFPLMWYSLTVGLIFLLIAFLLGLLGGGVAVVVSAAKGQDSTLALFLGIFFSLVLVLVGITLILLALAVAVYGFAVLFFERRGSIATVKDAVRFLWTRQDAFWLYVILFLAYVITSFIVMLVVYPFNLIPLIGPIISFPFQILSYIVQGYLGLVILAVIFTYYFKETRGKSEALSSAEPLPGIISGNSMNSGDISSPEVPSPETPRQAEPDREQE